MTTMRGRRQTWLKKKKKYWENSARYITGPNKTSEKGALAYMSIEGTLTGETGRGGTKSRSLVGVHTWGGLIELEKREWPP